MPHIPKHIVTDHTRPHKEIILEKLGYEKVEDSIETPDFEMEHIEELISRGIIPIHCLREIDGTVYIRKEIAAILNQAYRDLIEVDSEEENKLVNSDVVSRVESNFTRLVDIQIDQLENFLAEYRGKLKTNEENEEENLMNHLGLLKKRAELKKLYGR
jgi:hypothetical protein